MKNYKNNTALTPTAARAPSMGEFQRQTDMRYYQRTSTGTMRGGVCQPLAVVPFLQHESGYVQQMVNIRLGAIPGEVITPIRAQVISVYVPDLALEALKNPADDYAGNTEIYRDKVAQEVPLTDLEEETDISKLLDLNPKSVAGTKYISERPRLAYIAAVNFLYRRLYDKAEQLDNTQVTPAPAPFTQTSLDMLNAVLDPETRVNGAVDLSLNISLEEDFLRTDVSGIAGLQYVEDDQGNPLTPAKGAGIVKGDGDYTPLVAITGNGGSDLSLTDFYIGQMKDEITRAMGAILEANPEYGEEMLLRWVHGLNLDSGKQPFIVYDNTETFEPNVRPAMDGPNLDESQSDFYGTMNFTVPVPKNEFGGQVVTIAIVRPDEVLADQPDPIYTEPHVGQNFALDRMSLDPVPVTARELHSGVGVANETDTMLYVGYNGLKKRYATHGYNRKVDRSTVERKSAVWQVELPLSVTPETVAYPANLDHYMFALNAPTDEPIFYTVNTAAQINTPMVFGPTPVERLEILDNESLLEVE